MEVCYSAVSTVEACISHTQYSSYRSVESDMEDVIYTQRPLIRLVPSLQYTVAASTTRLNPILLLFVLRQSSFALGLTLLHLLARSLARWSCHRGVPQDSVLGPLLFNITYSISQSLGGKKLTTHNITFLYLPQWNTSYTAQRLSVCLPSCGSIQLHESNLPSARQSVSAHRPASPVRSQLAACYSIKLEKSDSTLYLSAFSLFLGCPQHAVSSHCRRPGRSSARSRPATRRHTRQLLFIRALLKPNACLPTRLDSTQLSSTQ